MASFCSSFKLTTNRENVNISYRPHRRGIDAFHPKAVSFSTTFHVPPAPGERLKRVAGAVRFGLQAIGCWKLPRHFSPPVLRYQRR